MHYTPSNTTKLYPFFCHRLALYALLLCLLSTICFLPLLAQGHILDDSTRNVYGPSTTHVFGTQTFFDPTLDSLHLRPTLDSLLGPYKGVSLVEKSEFSRTNLGALGSASRSFLYEAPPIPGTRSGLVATLPFLRKTTQVPFYNTRSPLLNADIFFGARGRVQGAIDFSRNINPKLNFSLGFQRSTIDKQLGIRLRDDFQTRMTNYYLQLNQLSAESPYAFYFLVSGFIYNQIDQGGNTQATHPSPRVRYDRENAIPWLRQAQANTRFLRVETLHRYRLKKSFYLYAKLHYESDSFSFNDNLNGQDSSFYRRTIINTEETDDALGFRALALSAGILGEKKGFQYRLYTLSRWIAYAENKEQLDTSFPQYQIRKPLVGLSLKGTLKSILLKADIAWLLFSRYRARLSVQTKFMHLRGWSERYAPTAIQQTYQGNHHQWNQSLKDPIASGLSLTIPLLKKNPALKLEGTGNYLNHFIYLNRNEIMTQATKSIGLLHGSAFAQYSFIHNHLVIDGRYSYRGFFTSSHPSFAFPTHQAVGKLYYQGKWFADRLAVQTGARIRWRSAYFGHAYQPAIQQFYVQRQFLLENYAIIDFFFRVKFDNVRFFFQILHLNQSPTSNYFSTPYYIGPSRFFDIGLQWYLFD